MLLPGSCPWQFWCSGAWLSGLCKAVRQPEWAPRVENDHALGLCTMKPHPGNSCQNSPRTRLVPWRQGWRKVGPQARAHLTLFRRQFCVGKVRL